MSVTKLLVSYRTWARLAPTLTHVITRDPVTSGVSCIRKENYFQLILQHAAYHQIKGFDFAYNYKTTFDFLYM